MTQNRYIRVSSRFYPTSSNNNRTGENLRYAAAAPQKEQLKVKISCVVYYTIVTSPKFEKVLGQSLLLDIILFCLYKYRFN
ncbi:hypothetical protein FQR65_LT01076 [Abscondita terminalis]|nr:hypothetical protein FQR65_LT01076 [Abscondita terminalis]